MMGTRTMRWALLAVLVASCGSEELTQLMVVIDTDLQVPGELDEIAIEILGPAGDRKNAEAPVVADDLPMRLAVVHRGGPLGPVTVKVEGLGVLPDGRRGALIQRRAVVDFVEGEVRVLRMDLLRECRGMVCGSDETCAEGGECRPRQVGEDELAPWEGPVRLDFGMPDMGPADMADGCVPSEELCNGEDDDCDERVDEGFDLDVDMRNCGECGKACDVDPVRGSTSCQAGKCVLACDEGFADCDEDDDDTMTGCEASLDVAATCGDCDRTCEGSTPVCDGDLCVSACADGSTLCGDSCADLQGSVLNCGTCGMECPDAENASPLCAEGDCRLRCDTGFFDCDLQSSNGCESRHRELANCGACGAICEADEAVTSCATGSCELVTCEMGFGDCDDDLMNGCEADLAGDPTTCGTCDNVCPIDPANGSASCTMGSCDVTCDAGYANCNEDPADGCETFLGETTSCGGCGISCDGASPSCSGSTTTGFACASGCEAGETACGDSCVDVSSDVRNCGGCGTVFVCPDPMRASPTCVEGACGFSCDAGFDDCDGDASNGCETPLTTTDDCGSCDSACDPATDATIGCVMSSATRSCAITACSGTKRDCDGVYANGCEADITASTDHCGGCGVVCTPGPRVATVTCDGGRCEIDSCADGFADCDGDFATGCETRLGTKFDCGSCGDFCRGAGGAQCCDGVCC